MGTAAPVVAAIVMRVLVINHAQVPSDVLAQAQAAASRIYLGAGIEVDWGAPGTERPLSDFRLTVTIVPEAQTRSARQRNVLGLALIAPTGPSRLLYAFYEAIRSQARVTGSEPGIVLGHVMAHEMGHLLLGRRAHALSGIMQAQWDFRQSDQIRTGSLTFTADEVAIIRQTALQ